MTIHSSNTLFELLARAYYGFWCGLGQSERPIPVEYRNRRWYRRDRQQRVIKVARTYFDVMQPCSH